MALYNDIVVPDNETPRVAAVKSYGVLGTPPEQDCDDSGELAVAVTGCQVGYIAVFDEAYSRLKARYDVPLDRPDRLCELSLCPQTMMETDLFIVPNLRQEPHYADPTAIKNPPYAKTL